MKRWKVLVSILVAGVALLLMVGFSANARGRGQGEARAETHGLLEASLGNAAATEVVTSTFSYQGVLKESNEPVTGDREMVFALYNDDACATMVGSPVTYTVSVNDGFFDVNLAFNQTYFNGQALWLQTKIEGSAIGCQTIQSVPYANSLRPGAVISGPVTSDGNLLHVRSGSETTDEGVVGAQIGRRSSLNYPVGVYGYAYEFGSVGVWGVSDSQFGWGVNGVANGTESAGVRGIANAFNTTTYGVYGEANSSEGYAGYFEHTASTGGGIALSAIGPTGGIITGTDGIGLSVYASGSAGGDDALRGDHAAGDGIVGYSDGSGDLDNGIIGFTGVNGGYGVYGFSNNPGQYAGYFDGPVYAAGGVSSSSFNYIARNTSTKTLQKGEAVRADGVETLMAGAQQPVMQVGLAQATDQILGVVVGRTEMSMVEPGADDAKPGPHYGPVGGPAEPGDYLVIAVQGMAQVRVDPASSVQAGDRIGLSTAGAAQAVDVSSFGMILDQADEEGLAWALIGLH